MKLAIVFQRLGPYHHARLAALHEAARIQAIEVVRADPTYGWNLECSRRPYPIITLFDDISECRSRGLLSERMAQCLTGMAPDIVCLPGWSSSAALAGLAWCSARGVPAVLMSDSTSDDAHRVWWKEWVKSRIVGRYASALVAGARHADYVVRLGLARSKVFCGYDVVDNAYFHDGSSRVRAQHDRFRRQFDLPDRYFLASSRFIEKKNLIRLIDAYGAYVSQCDDPWSLVLLGDGPLRGTLERRIAEAGLSNLVRRPGFKQYDELPVYYALAAAFVHASTTEQWGLVVNEAMASGLPVLVSGRCGCAPDLVEDGRNGHVFNPCDTDELAGLMRKLSSQDCDREAMGRASREIIAHWTPATFSDGLMRAVERGMSGRPPPATLLDKALLWALASR